MAISATAVAVRLVRATHALTVFACGVGSAALLYRLLTLLPESRVPFERSTAEVVMPWLFTAAFLLPSARAMLRVVRRRPFLPSENVIERPIVSTLATFFGGLAALGLAWFIWVLTAFSPEERGDANLAGPAVLVLCWYALALGIGEFVLVPNKKAVVNPAS